MKRLQSTGLILFLSGMVFFSKEYGGPLNGEWIIDLVSLLVAFVGGVYYISFADEDEK